MSDQSTEKPGNWLQKAWWKIRDLYQQLKPCRFSFFVALIAVPVFLCVAQGTEVLRTVGEGMAANDFRDPGPYRNPEGTVAYEFNGAIDAPPR